MFPITIPLNSDLGFALGSFGSKLAGIKTSVSVVYSPFRNTINALFLGEVTEGLDWVEKGLELYKPLTDNPVPPAVFALSALC